jgi:hypothetical protein
VCESGSEHRQNPERSGDAGLAGGTEGVRRAYVRVGGVGVTTHPSGYSRQVVASILSSIRFMCGSNFFGSAARRVSDRPPMNTQVLARVRREYRGVGRLKDVPETHVAMGAPPVMSVTVTESGVDPSAGWNRASRFLSRVLRKLK